MANEERQNALCNGIGDKFKADARLFHNVDLSDLNIVCGPKSFKVHKAVVCLRSEFFDSACLKGSFKEKQDGVVTLKAREDEEHGEDFAADHPEAVEYLVRYLHFNDYLSEQAITQQLHRTKGIQHLEYAPREVNAHDIPLAIHAEIFAVAVKYSIPGLKALSQVYFKQILELVAVSETELANALPVVFKTTPEDTNELRELMCDAMIRLGSKGSESLEMEAAISSVEGLDFQLYRRAMSGTKATSRDSHDCRNHGRGVTRCMRCDESFWGCYKCGELGISGCSGCR